MAAPRLPVAPRLLAVIVVLGLAACTDWGPGPDLAGATMTAVTIRYDRDKVSAAKADATAQEYCAGLGRTARLRSRFGNTPAMTYADYDCRPKSPKG